VRAKGVRLQRSHVGALFYHFLLNIKILSWVLFDIISRKGINVAANENNRFWLTICLIPI